MLKSPSIRIDALLFTVIFVAAMIAMVTDIMTATCAGGEAFLPSSSLERRGRRSSTGSKPWADENLRRLPNYTCTETIQRSLRLDWRAKLRPYDNVRLNVAYVEGKELFGRPGDPRDQPDLGQLVGKPIGNGQFALYVKLIFSGQNGTFGPSLKTRLEGRQAFRFEYTIPISHSGLRIHSGVGQAVVGFSGSFWVARDSLDLMRLTVSADHIPDRVNISSDATAIDYGQISIGGTAFPLPLRSIWQTQDAFGQEARNVTTFENCHEFVGESVLKFGDP